ncbi:hypothetical protein EYF80_013832 [Liparis tanakae]|uniref:Uncharacterized protein n=1 Tax=Liparis tanakae TaxID=230148 RepID=A0A4Z2IEW3_9TELE|nr:hypothetical protein EYF80_013832 [Liparis tanakae]
MFLEVSMTMMMKSDLGEDDESKGCRGGEGREKRFQMNGGLQQMSEEEGWRRGEGERRVENMAVERMMHDFSLAYFGFFFSACDYKRKGRSRFQNTLEPV